MKVSELIAELQKLPADAAVCVDEDYGLRELGIELVTSTERLEYVCASGKYDAIPLVIIHSL